MNLEEDLLTRAIDDWLDPTTVIGAVVDQGLTDPELRRDAALGVLVRLIAQGFLVPGQLVEGRFRPWASRVGDSILRIVREWDSYSDPGQVFDQNAWFDLTPTGEERAQGVRDRDEGNH